MSGTRIQSSAGWLCVDGRLGYIAGPQGDIRYQAATGYNRRGAAEDCISFITARRGSTRYVLVIPDVTPEATRRAVAAIRWEQGETAATLRFEAPRSGFHEVSLSMPDSLAFRRAQVPVSAVTASSFSPKYAPDFCIDGDITTFWVSRRGQAEPGDGPTPEAPERLDFVLQTDALVTGILVFPRIRYGPRKVRIQLGKRTVFEGEMDSAAPLRVALETPVEAGSASLEILSSHDPRFPEAPRNTQVAEVLFLSSDARGH